MVPLPGSQFITITLPPRAYKYKAADQFARVKKLLVMIFSVHCDQWCLVAELSNQSNVHFHGWFTEMYHQSTLILIDVLKDAYFGFTKVNAERINQVNRTFVYMTKDLEITKKLIKDPVISLHIMKNKKVYNRKLY